MRSFLVRYKKVVGIVVVTIVGINLLIISGMYFYLWSNDGGVARYLLPPYHSANYFLFYSLTRVWSPYLISFALAILWVLVMRYENKKRGEQFFYPEEYLLALLSIGIVGWPSVIVFFLMFLIVFMIGSIMVTVIKGKEARMSSQYLWIPVALSVILLQELVFKGSGIWNLLKI